VQLAASDLSAPDQPCRLEHGEVLANRLAGQRELMHHRESRAEGEERLAALCTQLVEEQAPRRRGEGFEEIRHSQIIGKSQLACQD
jgi:hypothetical protein